MVAEEYRKAIESQYIGVCSIYNYSVADNGHGVDRPVKIKVAENIKCRLSYKSKKKGDGNSMYTGVEQEIKLFMAPDITVPPGSAIEVTQHGRTEEYKSSGKAAVYSNHQEIILELADNKA